MKPSSRAPPHGWWHALVPSLLILGILGSATCPTGAAALFFLKMVTAQEAVGLAVLGAALVIVGLLGAFAADIAVERSLERC